MLFYRGLGHDLDFTDGLIDLAHDGLAVLAHPDAAQGRVVLVDAVDAVAFAGEHAVMHPVAHLVRDVLRGCPEAAGLEMDAHFGGGHLALGTFGNDVEYGGLASVLDRATAPLGANVQLPQPFVDLIARAEQQSNTGGNSPLGEPALQNACAPRRAVNRPRHEDLPRASCGSLTLINQSLTTRHDCADRSGVNNGIFFQTSTH